MPTDACQSFYVCTGCGTKLRPKSGDCCVKGRPPIQAFGPMDAKNFQVTFWHKDAIRPAEADGVAFNANYLLRDDLMVFLRGGKSEGWLINANLNSGFAWRPFKTNEDLFGFGAGWALPANSLLRDQYVFEVFYRYQLTSNLAFTPDLQYILRPSGATPQIADAQGGSGGVGMRDCCLAWQQSHRSCIGQ